MEFISGVSKENNSDYAIYYVEYLSDELKEEIRKRLVAVCHGADQACSEEILYSYKETVREFIRRYKTDRNTSEERKKGMIGELLVHVLVEIEGHYTTASPFFNMEERSFKKGYDIALFDASTHELWIAEIKSGSKQKNQKNSSSTMVGLINTAKNDLKTRLNDANSSLWLNAINAAKVSMSESNQQKDAVIKLLAQCGSAAVSNTISSENFNVVLAGTVFHPVSEPFEPIKVCNKHSAVVREGLFKRVFVIAIQKSTFEAVYDFLESEAADED